MKRMENLATRVLALAAAGALTACGSSGPSSFDGEAAISLTGSEEPAETVADQAARIAAIVARADAIVASTIYGEVDGQEIHFVADCRGTQCTHTDPSTGSHHSEITLVDLLDLDPATGTRRAVMTRNGITLAEVRGGTGRPGFRTYGAWTEHGSFSVQTGIRSPSGDGPIFTARGALAGGHLAGSLPSASATWLGVMVGTPARGSSRDSILQGDARLIYDLEGQTLDAEFTGIFDLDRNSAHTVGTVSFDNVPVAANGTFGDDAFEGSIEGGFGGPGHEEAGGVFERQGIVGAFGVKRQASD